jgi:hypothetical protein
MPRVLLRSAAPLAVLLALAGCAQPSSPAAPPATAGPTAEPTAEPTVEPTAEPAVAEAGEPRVPLECAELVPEEVLGTSFDETMTEIPHTAPGSPASAALDQAGALTCGWRGGEPDDAGFYGDSLHLDVLTDAAFEVPNGEPTVDSTFGTRFDTFAEESSLECSGGPSGFGCEVDGEVGAYWFSARIDSGLPVADIDEALDFAERLGTDVAAALALAEPLEPNPSPASDLPRECVELDRDRAVPAAFPELQLGDPSTPGGDGYGRAAYQAWQQVGFLNCGWHDESAGFLQLNALPGGAWAWDVEAIGAEGRADTVAVAVPNADESVSLCREYTEGTWVCFVHFTSGEDFFNTSASDEDRGVAAERALGIATAWAETYLG